MQPARLAPDTLEPIRTQIRNGDAAKDLQRSEYTGLIALPAATAIAGLDLGERGVMLRAKSGEIRALAAQVAGDAAGLFDGQSTTQDIREGDLLRTRGQG